MRGRCNPEISSLSVRKEAADRNLTAAGCDNFTTGKTANTEYPWVSTVSPHPSVSLLSSFWLTAHGECVFCLGSLFKPVERDDESDPPPPPPNHLKGPPGIMRFDTVTSRLLKKRKVFFWSDVIYLVVSWHPVMMICHSSLLRALYLYMIGLLLPPPHPPTVFLWLYHPFFCAISATNEKNKEKDYFMCPVIHSPPSSLSCLIVKPSCFCGMIGLDTLSRPRHSRVIPAVTPHLN